MHDKKKGRTWRKKGKKQKETTEKKKKVFLTFDRTWIASVNSTDSTDASCWPVALLPETLSADSG